ncbi:LysM peptidoglycan-binding domain-containing protein [Lederbergia lenta]|uniref:LysM domain n=1 Tax=Lederbergia lenta TaxID=1467 RepID=A0A2X4YXH4_LEDLE|nr:LysM domain-containing protein [Lederbergia lenta]MCM3112384.1 LysM peptidoglycan-binding domain-containing protein [Lederbergia lenta]MEC2326603.1 LysM domain-containing protein [Lederbergia lenta]SQI53054.1 LysM domain [Lederbergia lenta]
MKRFYAHTIQPGDNYWLLAYKYNTTVEAIFAENYGVNPYYLSIGQRIAIPVPQTIYQQRQPNHCISQEEVDYRNDMRSLWEEHVAWTRMAIISLTFNLPDVDFVITRLLQNATDMGNMIRKLYGDFAAKTYANLIKEHLLLAADLVKATLAGDKQAAMTAEQKWYTNADQIAEFLSSVNPFLPENVVRDMFYKHLDLTKQEAVFMINMDYQKDIETYDKIEKEAREMADTISDAMVKLYPKVF